MKSVLIIDDNEIDRLIHRKILEGVTYVKKIHTASNGLEGIALLNDYFQQFESLPNLILLDLNMPVMDGFSFVDSFKKLPLKGKDDVTIIMVTSSESNSDIALAKERGIDLYLAKPLSENKLLAVMGWPQSQHYS